MAAKKFIQISADLESSVEIFIQQRRQQISNFVNNQFSMNETIQIQKSYFWYDLMANPINAVWSLPYLSIKKIFETFDKIGWNKLTKYFQMIPSGIKTGYQKHIENLVAKEILGWDPKQSTESSALQQIINQHPALVACVRFDPVDPCDFKYEFHQVLESYSASRALISDLAGSLLTLLAGWFYFGDKSLGIMGLGDRIAQRMAHKKASSHFFLGKNVGSKFYSLFPPEPTHSQIFASTLFVVIAFTLLTFSISAFSDPLRKKIGLQEKKLNTMLDELEVLLLTQYKRRLKQTYE